MDSDSIILFQLVFQTFPGGGGVATVNYASLARKLKISVHAEGGITTHPSTSERQKSKTQSSDWRKHFFCARILEENERGRSKLPNGRETPASRETDISLLKARL